MTQQCKRLPIPLTETLLARLSRIAIRKQGTSNRVFAAMGREAVLAYVEREEKDMSLAPITQKEIRELVNDK